MDQVLLRNIRVRPVRDSRLMNLSTSRSLSSKLFQDITRVRFEMLEKVRLQ